MRLRHLLGFLFPLASAFCGASAESPVFFDDRGLSKQSPCVDVDSLDTRQSTVADITQAGDSSFLVLYAQDREVVVYDARLHPVHTLTFDRDGPRGIRSAASAATDGRFFYIADEQALLIKTFDFEGRDRGSVRFDFVPHRVRVAGRSVYMTPMVLSNHPTTMLFELRPGGLAPLPVPIARYESPAIAAFANLGSLATYSNGRVVVMHEMVVPFGYSLAPSASAPLLMRFPVPLPRAVKSKAGSLPQPPITEDNIGGLLAAALTATPNPRTGGMFYLTRTGAGSKGHWEKMIVEVDSLLQFRRGVRVPGNPLHIVFVPPRESVLTVDEEGQWYECKLP